MPEPRDTPSEAATGGGAPTSAESPLDRLSRMDEFERARLAQHLHDSLGQNLTAFRLLIPQLARNDGAARDNALVELQRLTQAMAADLHTTTLSLRAASLGTGSIAEAVRGLVEEWSATTGVAATCHLATPLPALSPAVEAVVYRVLQEALSNVVRHASARSLSLILAPRSPGVELIVEDDGAGFEVAQLPPARESGLRLMRDRAALVGGELVIESSLHHGTTVFLRVPATVPAIAPAH